MAPAVFGTLSRTRIAILADDASSRSTWRLIRALSRTGSCKGDTNFRSSKLKDDWVVRGCYASRPDWRICCRTASANLNHPRLSSSDAFLKKSPAPAA